MKKKSVKRRLISFDGFSMMRECDRQTNGRTSLW